MSNDISYEKAYEELVEICNKLENDEIMVSELTEKVKRATELIAICRKALKSTDEEIIKVLEQIDK